MLTIFSPSRVLSGPKGANKIETSNAVLVHRPESMLPLADAVIWSSRAMIMAQQKGAAEVAQPET